MLLTRLDRYVFREILSPLVLGLFLWTFILLLDALFDAAETIIHRDVAASLVGKLLLLSLPHIVVLTIPMAFLFAILIAVGRLSADSELIAMRASGISLFSLYRPVLLFSAILTAANCYLMIDVLPRGNAAREDLMYRILARSVTQEVKPRVFHELGNRVIYVFDTAPDGRWKGVFVAEAVPRIQHKITVAAYGEVLVNEAGERAILSLENAVDREVDLNDPVEQQTSSNAKLAVAFEDEVLPTRSSAGRRGVRELPFEALLAMVNDPERSLLERRLARVEIHKKFAIPAACLVFGLFGVPFGFNNRRGGSKSSGFAMSIGVILVYYVLLNNGEEAAAAGRLPAWMAIWGPNVLLTVVGAFLLTRRNRDKSLLLTRLDRFIRQNLWPRVLVLQRLRQFRRRRRQRLRVARSQGTAEAPARTDVVVRLPRPRLLFPNLFDRYIISIFTRVLLIVVAAGIAIYIIANFTDLADEILENKIPTSVVLEYYKYLSMQIFYTIAPFVVLLTTLVTFALLCRSNEVTAAKALGMSLYRLAIPAVVAALLVAGFSVLLETSVLPASNARVAELKDRIMGRERVRTFRRADRQWLFGKGGYIYNYLHYDAATETLQRLHVYRFDDSYRLTGRLYADRAEYRDDAWVVTGGWARNFEGDEETYTPLAGPQPVDLPELPGFFDSETKSPDQMNIAELRQYIAELKTVGQRVPELEVELHNKLAMPVVCLVMALVALPFAFRLGKAGALYGIGLSLLLGMAFYAIIAFFTTLGAADALPPAVAAWSPNLFFATLSLYLFLGIRT